ncbi:hypothetical protein, partial [Xanthomonas vasicola]
MKLDIAVVASAKRTRVFLTLRRLLVGMLNPIVFSEGRIELRDGLINATGKRSNRIRRAEGAQIA